MADVQLEHGHTRIAHPILEALSLAPFNASQLKVALVVIRETYGWSRKEAPISQTQFQAATGLHRDTVKNALRELTGEGVVRVVREATFTDPAVYRLQKDPEEWGRFSTPTPSGDPEDAAQGGGQSSPTPGGQESPRGGGAASPTPGGQETPSPGAQPVAAQGTAAAERKGKKEKETTKPPSSSDERSGMGAAADGGDDDEMSRDPPDDDVAKADAIADMEAIANAGAERISAGMPRKRYNATVRILVSGSDATAWRHPRTGLQVPWRDRPMLLDNAIAILEAGERDTIRRALQLAIQRQKDPLPLRTSEEVMSSAEEAEHYDRHRQESARRPSSDGPAPIGAASDPEEERRRREDDEDRRIREWEEEHPDEAARLRDRAAAEVAGDERLAALSEETQRRLALSKYRIRIRDELEAETQGSAA